MKFAYDIPDSFWSLFRSMNRELYMEALLKINEEYEYNNYKPDTAKQDLKLADQNGMVKEDRRFLNINDQYHHSRLCSGIFNSI